MAPKLFQWLLIPSGKALGELRSISTRSCHLEGPPSTTVQSRSRDILCNIPRAHFEILAGLDEAVWKSCPEGFGHMSPVSVTTSNSSIFTIRKVTQYLAYDLRFVLHFLIPVQPSEGPSRSEEHTSELQ